MKFSNEKFDPSKTSIYEEALELEQGRQKRTIFHDVNTGEKFHNISRDNFFYEPKILFDPEKERFASLLLKGIVNTADIVKDPKTGEFFSHEQNLGNLSPDKKYFVEGLEADIVIINCIFSDLDREYVERKLKGFKRFNNLISKDDWHRSTIIDPDEVSLNMMVNKKKSKSYQFDFGHALFYTYSVLNKDGENLFKEFVKKILKERDQGYKIGNNVTFLKILSNKLDAIFMQCFEGEEDRVGSFFDAVAKRSELEKSKTLISLYKDIQETERIPTLYKEMKKRAEVLREIVNDKLQNENVKN